MRMWQLRSTTSRSISSVSYVYVYVRIFMRTYVCVYVRTYVRMCIRTYVRTYVCEHLYQQHLDTLTCGHGSCGAPVDDLLQHTATYYNSLQQTATHQILTHARTRQLQMTTSRTIPYRCAYIHMYMRTSCVRKYIYQQHLDTRTCGRAAAKHQFAQYLVHTCIRTCVRTYVRIYIYQQHLDTRTCGRGSCGARVRAMSRQTLQSRLRDRALSRRWLSGSICSVLQCVATCCCNVLQCVAVCCNICCSKLQYRGKRSKVSFVTVH